MTPKQMRKTVLNGLTSNGVHVQVSPPLLLCKQIKKFLRHNKINLVIDVGAYHGDYCKMLRERAQYTGTIISFEPSADSFRVLSAAMCDDPNWRGFRIGLSDTDSVAILNNYGNSEMFNSVLGLREQHALAYSVDLAKRSSETVRLRTIDTMWGKITKGISSPRVFLKIDTQGHDTAVVRGAVEHLEYIYGIQSELPAIEIYEGMTSMPAALDLYRKLGYVPIGFYPVNTPSAFDGISPEFDVVLKRLQVRNLALP